MTSPKSRFVSRESDLTPGKAKLSPAPFSHGALSPKRGRGRPVGSFKVKSHRPKPVALIDGVPRRPGRPIGSTKKEKHRVGRPPKLGDIRAAEGASQKQPHVPAERSANGTPEVSDCDTASPRDVQDVTCTHDFSILSLSEMQRLAAASAAAAIRRFSQDPRFAAHAAELETSAADLEKRSQFCYDDA